MNVQKEQDHKGGDIRKLCKMKPYKRKLFGDIEGLSKARSKGIKSTTGDDDDSNPD